MNHHIIVIGAGPTGLCLARALRGSGLSVCLIEQQDHEALATPAFDGREIALTQRSRRVLQQLGIWQRLDPAHVSPLKDALVLNGGPGQPMNRMDISHRMGHVSELGHLVANHRIRSAAFAAALEPATGENDAPPELICGEQVTQIKTDAATAYVTLSDGRTLTARLAVAADSRHSSTRRGMGIAADMHDYGRTMLVCNMTHHEPHHATAWEWFGHSQTLALLPMNPDTATGEHRSSVVLTLPHHKIQPLLEMSPEAFSAALSARFDHRLGLMQLVSTRHAYPLVGVWARHFAAERFALVGDAAVGMHPVTAHGFNLGLRSVETLSQALVRAHTAGEDIAAPALLQRYQQAHRLSSRGLYLATHTLASLYTRESMPAHLLRQALVRLGDRITPFKSALAGSLTGLR